MQEDMREPMTTRDMVNLLADLSEQIEILIGKKGAISVFRYAGRQLGQRLATGQNGNEERAREVVASFFQSKDFIDNIKLDGKDAELNGCKIGLVLNERGIEAGSHPLCNFGFGLIDGVTRAVTGEKIVTLHVSSEYHPEGITCRETW